MSEEEEIRQYIFENELYDKSRKRSNIDPRNYLISILYYKYDWTEEDLGDLVDRDRTSINHCKELAYHLRDDDDFLRHTKRVRELFPYTIPKPEDRKYTVLKRKTAISVSLTDAEYEKLRKLRKYYNSRTIGIAIKTLLFKVIDDEFEIYEE